MPSTNAVNLERAVLATLPRTAYRPTLTLMPYSNRSASHSLWMRTSSRQRDSVCRQSLRSHCFRVHG